ncbi:triosephosphate isomerase [Natranaerovirga pectinivora]|uniref:Triosephosphate isomerase n=1 Tax=Natranaerovirga pectinivora TaxID=682400 RepID=A0A4R3MPJ0_9FIRM|nr:triose-phosphate isomerase [Natranaerovirga pectinivora]TCT16191.1 triosephosphate isomerase [Natranaerovirga pectinivora]
MRKILIAGNWKMNKTPKETVEFINAIKGRINREDLEVVMFPPFLSLTSALEAIEDTNLFIGAQNMYYEDNGAYTGEISPKMLTEIGIKYVIIGHSERRSIFKETNEMVNLKLLKALEHNITPIVCVGESLKQREELVTIDFIRMQIKIAFKNVPREDVKKVVVAYEPLWAIGTGRNASKTTAEEVCKAIRGLIADLYDEDTSESVRILYGGSVKSSNVKEYFSQPNIDGGIIGGASLNEDFINIVNFDI